MARTDERGFRLRPRRPARSRKGESPVVWATAYVAVLNQAKISRKRGASQPGRPTKPYSQRCSVRVTYSNRTVKGHWRAHGPYIKRDSEGHGGKDVYATMRAADEKGVAPGNQTLLAVSIPSSATRSAARAAGRHFAA
jgi:hypothetical protein